LQPVSVAALTQDIPETVGIISVDVIKGFCTIGPLSSPRVNDIVAPIRLLFEQAWAAGVRDIALPQDTHDEDAVEFAQYGPHCIRGTEESETVDAFQSLPFFDQLAVFHKNSIASGLNAGLDQWVRARSHIRTWIIVGDCTDLCTYQLAMYVRLRANEEQIRGVRVILPVNTVDTYDMPVATAKELGIVPHDAEFLHLVFLYHMMLNGIEVVTEVTA
ncbi:MAG: isochorismatase family protein, partial [Anaerolineae bacterium]|nr:isochorismatase family protein [Anaerolineae bacterium]